jgi:hypothetical protein
MGELKGYRQTSLSRAEDADNITHLITAVMLAINDTVMKPQIVLSNIETNKLADRLIALRSAISPDNRTAWNGMTEIAEALRKIGEG